MKIVWKDGIGSFYNGVKAEDIVSELNKISTTTITPEQVLSVARDDSSIMHQFFEWNDTVAAEKYRKIQAQQLILKIAYVRDEEDNQPKRYYHNISYSTREYHPVEYIFQHEDAYSLLKKRAIDYLRNAEKKFAEIKELESIWPLIRQTLDGIDAE